MKKLTEKIKKTAVLIVAGGNGERFGGKKQFVNVGGKSVLWHSINKFVCYGFEKICVVLPANCDENEKNKVELETEFSSIKFFFAEGGKTRQKSVFSGLQKFAEDFTEKSDFLLIHDAVRPFFSEKLLDNILVKLEKKCAVIPVLAATDSITFDSENGLIYLPREKVYLVQTPQGFYFSEIFLAHLQQQNENFSDDASLLKKAFSEISLVNVDGESENRKITTQKDL